MGSILFESPSSNPSCHGAMEEDERLLSSIITPVVGSDRASAFSLRLIARWGSLARVLHADRVMLREFGEFSHELAFSFKLVREAAKRLSVPNSVASVQGLASIIRTSQINLMWLPREECLAFFFDKEMQLIHMECVGRGTVGFVHVSPRELARRSLQLNAGHVVLAHNHPSGDPVPSKQDWEMTLHLDHVLHLIGVELLEHIIVGEGAAHCMFGLKEFLQMDDDTSPLKIDDTMQEIASGAIRTDPARNNQSWHVFHDPCDIVDKIEPFGQPDLPHQQEDRDGGTSTSSPRP